MQDQYSILRIKSLHPLAIPVFTNFINECEKTFNVVLRISDGYRSFKDQFNRYAQGRTTPGPIISYAQAGYSFHEYGLAVDLYVMDGKILNTSFNMAQLAPIADKYGIKWGGSFSKSKIDPPHFEIGFGYNIHELFTLRQVGNVDANLFVSITPKK